ncbi:MAG: heme A synthase [Chloroflexi bacterium]|nr:heme A synthase [Chloroflexota bacterium]MYE39881.1 heme A synthase [Chloroflexota bacterium]
MAVAVGGRFRADSLGADGWFRVLVWVTVASVYAMLVLGGVVRVTESGLGCGDDWPLCAGQWLPPLESKAIIEYAHRVAASFLVGPLIVATFICAWLRYRREPWIIWPAAIAVVLVIIQALLGGLTVTTELSGHVVMTHLAVAELTLACCVLLAVMAHRGGMRDSPATWAVGKTRLFPPLAMAAAVALFLLILSGSYLTNTASATWACNQWPLCTNEWGGVFPGGKLALIHMVHRYVALVAGLFIIYALHLGFRGRMQPSVIRLLAMAALALFAAQVLAGAGMIWAGFGQDVEVRALHLALASGVWGVMVALVTLTYSRESRKSDL